MKNIMNEKEINKVKELQDKAYKMIDKLNGSGISQYEALAYKYDILTDVHPDNVKHKIELLDGYVNSFERLLEQAKSN